MDEWTLNDLLECSVCLERLDTSSKVLPCQHTFCKKCLDEIVTSHKELRCPECRVLVECKVDELPPNVLLMRILEGMKNNPKKRTPGNQTPGSPASEVQTPVHQRQNNSNNTPSNLTPQHIRQKSGELLTNHQRQWSGDQLNEPRNAQFKSIPNNQPIARAIYDYSSKEPGDLNFKKGDIIILRRKIDNNWFYGESNGTTGAFPMSYVQIMTPLPRHTPQCKALYDFRMNTNEEEGCLKFTKGEVITVIRRVDENWAEGRLSDKIGIFPLAFVEMNSVAKMLMKLSTNSQPGPSRIAPPTPGSEEVSPLIPNGPPIPPQTITIPALPPPTAQTVSTPSTRQEQHATPTSHTSPTSSSSSSTTTTPTLNSSSSNTTSSSSSESTGPSTPTSPPAPTPSKRHSLGHLMHSSLNSHSQPSTPHRYSAEILNPISTKEPESLPANLSQETSSSKSAEATKPEGAELKRQGSLRSYKKSSSGASSSTTTTTINVLSPTMLTANSKLSPHASLKTPALYIAIYPYKPQKPDELELRRGSVYTVIERCQDGWFKGTSNRTQKSGVFPGNYVAPAKSLPALQAQLRGLRSNSVGSSSRSQNVTSPPTIEPRQSGQSSTPKSSRPNKIGVISTITPPELPPRSSSPNPTSTSWHAGNSSSQSQTHVNLDPTRNLLGASLVIPPPNVSVPNTPTRTTGVGDKKKDKNSTGGVSLMKRLTNITSKSKSPPPPCYSMDNPVFEDGGTSTPPPAATSTPTVQQHVHQSRPADAARETNLSHNHRKSNSLDATSSPAATVSASDIRKPKQLIPPIRERFRCIVPYPPNSEYELELRVGDVIYVHKKRDDGWYKGTQQRTGRTGLFPASFVESF